MTPLVLVIALIAVGLVCFSRIAKKKEEAAARVVVIDEDCVLRNQGYSEAYIAQSRIVRDLEHQCRTHPKVA